MSSIQALIGKWREMAYKATPGPWQTRFLYRTFQAGRKDPGLMTETGKEQDWPDCEFIALSRTLLPALLDVVEQAEQMDRALTSYGPVYPDFLPPKPLAIHVKPKLKEALARLAEVGK